MALDKIKTWFSKIKDTTLEVSDKVKETTYKLVNPQFYIEDLLADTWITLNGKNPWDPQVQDRRLYKKIIFWWSLALGESYMEWLWTCEDLPEFFKKTFRWWLRWKTEGIKEILWVLHSLLVNLQSKSRSRIVIEEHYNLGNELYESFLDDLMAYTCWYFKTGNETLEEAQEAKIDLIADKLHLEPWMKIVDIWCGWGGLWTV